MMTPDAETRAAMVEAARKAWEISRAHGPGNIERAITAALAHLPDRYREGWIAGRNAAIAEIESHEFTHPLLSTMLRGLEPPE